MYPSPVSDDTRFNRTNPPDRTESIKGEKEEEKEKRFRQFRVPQRKSNAKYKRKRTSERGWWVSWVVRRGWLAGGLMYNASYRRQLEPLDLWQVRVAHGFSRVTG